MKHSRTKELGKVKRMLRDSRINSSYPASEPSDELVNHVLDLLYSLGIVPGDFSSARLRLKLLALREVFEGLKA